MTRAAGYTYQVESVLQSYEDREFQIVRLFGLTMGYSFVKPDDYNYRLDAFSPQANGAVWVEVKCREFPHDKYDHLRFDLDKVEAGIRKVQAFGHEFWLLAAFSDGVKLAYRYDPETAIAFRFTATGRLDRSDHEKVKPMVEIPRRLFARW